MQIAKLLLSIYLTTMVLGCVTYRTPSVFDAEIKQSEPICVDLDIKYADQGIVGSREILPVPEGYKIRLLYSLSVFGVQTNCSNPQAKFDVLIEDKNSIGAGTAIWGVASMFTFGIIPFVHNEEIAFSVSKQNEILSEATFEAKKVVSIIYVFKMFSDDHRALEKFKQPTRNAAELGFVLSNEIKKAFQKSSVKASNP